MNLLISWFLHYSKYFSRLVLMHFLWCYFIPGTRGKIDEEQISSAAAAWNFTLMVKGGWIQAWIEISKRSNR